MRSCWMLSYMRSGSTHLCRLLNSTGLFEPVFKEHYAGLRNLQPPETPPRFNKLMDFQYVQERQRKTTLFEHYPDMCFVRLRRRDIVASAVSQHFYYETKQANIVRKGGNKKLTTYQDIKVEYKKNRLISLWRQKLYQYHFWDKFAAEHDCIDVYHEDVLENPQKQCTRILRHVGVDREWHIDIKNPAVTVKLEHPQKEEFIAQLRDDLVALGLFAGGE